MDKQLYLSRFKTLNKNTQKAQNFISRYYKSNITCLGGCYRFYSNIKHLTFDEIKQDTLIYNMRDLRIISYNTFNYCVGALIENDNKCYLLVWTHYNEYKIELF